MEETMDLQKKTRQSNIELCRIVCMMLIIAHHCVCHGGGMNMEVCKNKYIAYAVLPGGKICFDAFLAISTWFLVDKKFKTERFLRTWLQVFFYSITFSIVAYCMGAPFVWFHWFSTLFPITGNSHGFAASYLAFYLLMPFLSVVSEKLNNKQAGWIALLLFYFQVVSKIIGAISQYSQPIFSELTLFVMFYFISLYLKKKNYRLLSNIPFLIVGSVIIWIAIFMYYVCANILLPGKPIWGYLAVLCMDESSLLNIIGGILIFFLFKSIKIPSSKIINTIAHTTFGILLIHDHNFFRPYCWNNIFHAQEWWYSNHYLIRIGICVLCIFSMGMIIDIARQYLLEKPIFSSNKVKKIVSKCDLILEIKKETVYDE